MIHFQLDKGKFNYRIAGILLRDEKVLFHKLEQDNYWTLPGGRAEMLEDSKATLVREFREELNCTVEVQNLHFICENFFSTENSDYHELGLIYSVTLKEGTIPSHQFKVKENDTIFQFHWLGLNELATENIRPAFLKQSLGKTLSAEIQHIIQR